LAKHIVLDMADRIGRSIYLESRQDSFEGAETVDLREKGMKKYAVALVAILVSGVAAAADLSAVVGHYRYQDYEATLPDGRVMKLQDLGVKDAFLDISDDCTITLRMTMLAGNPVVQSAKVLEAHFVDGKGYWVAQWPDIKGPVRANVTLLGEVLTSDSRFDDRSDPLRYGSTEHAVLKRVKP
jgi:hypothetical protein